MRRILVAVLVGVVLAGLTSCGSARQPTAPYPPATRTWRMGFSAIPPRLDFPLLLATLDLWTRRADAAIVHEGVPWDSLLAGTRADSLVIRQKLGLIQYYRSKGLRVVYTIDATNGLDRSAEDPALVAAGRSLAEPAIQALYRTWAVAVDTLLRPDQLGLAAETNLIRVAAPAPIYAAVRQVANDAAADVRVHDAAVPLYVSVQVEVAWGAFGGGTHTYQGIATDLIDFPFVQSLGLSSYPYLGGFADPDSVPLDYYTRIARESGRRVMVVEGGWASESAGGFVSSPAMQARYIRRQTKLLDDARATYVFQLTFTDLDLAASPPPPGSILPLFATLGLADVNLAPKPALAPWDSAFARPRN
jgi:hypothetical protein